mmetsp:Transcript_98598/g.136824  ORF Transcript_98598/g.136824 Transcript_98598/m.136824 type:complete len:90 (+) Transcript_98598:26-295(+)
MLQPLATPTQNIQPNSAFIQPRGESPQPANDGVRNLTSSAVSQDEETGATNRDDEQGREQRTTGERETLPAGNADARAQGRGGSLDIVV